MCLATRSSVNRLACVLIVRLLPAHASTQRRTRCSIVMVRMISKKRRARDGRESVKV